MKFSTTLRYIALFIISTLLLSYNASLANAYPPPEEEFEYGRNLVDTDGDGLPDEWEKHGFTTPDGVEFPLHLWGADPNRPDIFLEVHWMSPGGKMKSYRPHKDTFNQLVDLFAKHDIALHIDAGEYYTNIENFAEPRGGENIEYKLNLGTHDSIYDAFDELNKLRADRTGVFRTAAYVNEVYSDENYTGTALPKLDAFFVGKTEIMSERLIRNTTLHELGHTLGLTHNGPVSDSIPSQAKGSFYPEHKSVMNYLYQYTTFDYTHQDTHSTGAIKPLTCLAQSIRCFNGDYTVSSEWDNLNIKGFTIGSINGRTGVSQDTIDAAYNALKTDTASDPYGWSENSSKMGMAATIIYTIFGITTILSTIGAYNFLNTHTSEEIGNMLSSAITGIVPHEFQ